MSSPRKRGPIFQRRWLWVPSISAFTRVFDALCAGTTACELVRTRSARPGEGDFVEGAGAEAFGGAGHRLAAERPVEADRRLVVRERPDHQALQAALHQVAPRRGEQLAAEAEALEFRPQVKLVD